MFIIERLWRDAKAAPVVVRIGVVALVLSGVADVVLHAITPEVAGHDVHTPAELAAHFAGMVSMVVILLGVVVDGARSVSTRRGMRGDQPEGAS
ncbi:MAG: hypothetical protein ACJ765_11050 [Chloroflexota bacterium]